MVGAGEWWLLENGRRWRIVVAPPPSLQRLPVSSASQSPAPPSLQRLPVSSASHSPAPTSPQRLPFSSATSLHLPPSSRPSDTSARTHTAHLRSGLQHVLIR